MKKAIMLLGVVLFPAFAFALNAEAPEEINCEKEKATFERIVNSQRKTSHIMQYILVNLADDVEILHKYTEDQFVPLAQCYDSYVVKGTPLVDFVRAHADVFRLQAVNPDLQVFADMQNELLQFADRVERLSKQEALNQVVARHNEDWIVEHILNNFADPMQNLTDAQAAPKAVVYKQLKVRKQPLVEYAREQANRFEGVSSRVADDLNVFAQRVERLAK